MKTRREQLGWPSLYSSLCSRLEVQRRACISQSPGYNKRRMAITHKHSGSLYTAPYICLPAAPYISRLPPTPLYSIPQQQSLSLCPQRLTPLLSHRCDAPFICPAVQLVWAAVFSHKGLSQNEKHNDKTQRAPSNPATTRRSNSLPLYIIRVYTRYNYRREICVAIFFFNKRLQIIN